MFRRTSCFRAASLLCCEGNARVFPGTMWLQRWTEAPKGLGSKHETLMFLCATRGYAVGLLAAWGASQQTCAWVPTVLSQFGRRNVNCGLLNIETLFSRSQNHWQSGEWLGGRDPDYICPDLLIYFMHLRVIGLAQFLVPSFAVGVRG